MHVAAELLEHRAHDVAPQRGEVVALVEHDGAHAGGAQRVHALAGARREQRRELRRRPPRAISRFSAAVMRASSRARRVAAAPVHAAASAATAAGSCAVAAARSAVQRATAASRSAAPGSSSRASAW